MCKHIKVFPSLKEEENKVVLNDLRHLESEKGITFEFIGNVGILDDYIDLPSISTNEGDRIDGIEAIKYFLKGQLAS